MVPAWPARCQPGSRVPGHSRPHSHGWRLAGGPQGSWRPRATCPSHGGSAWSPRAARPGTSRWSGPLQASLAPAPSAEAGQGQRPGGRGPGPRVASQQRRPPSLARSAGKGSQKAGPKEEQPRFAGSAGRGETPTRPGLQTSGHTLTGMGGCSRRIVGAPPQHPEPERNRTPAPHLHQHGRQWKPSRGRACRAAFRTDGRMVLWAGSQAFKIRPVAPGPAVTLAMV